MACTPECASDRKLLVESIAKLNYELNKALYRNGERKMDLNEQIRSIRQPVVEAARRLFSTPDGKTVLDALEKVFPIGIEKTTTGAVDIHAMSINVGARMVVEQMKKWSEIP